MICFFKHPNELFTNNPNTNTYKRQLCDHFNARVESHTQLQDVMNFEMV